MNRLFLHALAGENKSGRPPVWLMRQAGRYLPEYKALRKKYTFLEMCHTPEIAAEVTLLPIRRFGFDAAILFSDILVIPEAMGVGLHFAEGKGPVIERPVTCSKDVRELLKPDVESSLGYVKKTIKLLKKELAVPLIGFCGAPFTVASYMIEGKSSPSLAKTKQWLLSDPEGFSELLDRVAELSIDYLKMQIKAGADALQIFDSWAGVLTEDQFQKFSLAYLEKLLKGIESDIPVILFCRGSSVYAEQLAKIKPAAVSLDWNCQITDMRQQIPQEVALQGNLDPSILLGSVESVQREVKQLINPLRQEQNYIFNLGHGILPSTPLESVRAMLDVVRA